eukprot:586580-Prorocentrum_minimum.AAC.1
MDFTRLLRSQSGEAKKPKLFVSTAAEGQTLAEHDSAALETPTLAAVERDFDTLLLREGSPSLISKPTVEVPTTSDALKEPVPVILEVRAPSRPPLNPI